MAIAGNLQSNAPVRNFFPSSVAVSVVETKQGFYKEYTVDKVDDSALDEVRRGYKTAEETEEGKNKVCMLEHSSPLFVNFELVIIYTCSIGQF